MLFALAIVLVQALAVQAGLFSDEYKGDDLGALCGGKDIDLTSLDELESLEVKSRFYAKRHNCPKEVTAAISDLFRIAKAKDICSPESVEQLRSYYMKYLDTSDGASLASTNRVPQPLRRFAIAYGLQVSNQCKKNMIKVLSDNLLSEEDYKVMGMFIGEGSPIVEALSIVNDPGEVLLPGDLAAILKKNESAHGSEEKLFLQSSAGAMIEKLQTVCERRFKPIYEPLMLPLVRLANIGFDYKDEPLRCDLECPLTTRQLGQWSTIVFMCETLGQIGIVEDPIDKEQAGESGGKLVRILTKEEAAAIGAINLNEKADKESGIAKLSYKPEPVVSTTLIVDKRDKKLLNAIKSIKTNRDEIEVIRKRLASKSLSLIMNELKRGNFGLIFSAAWKGLLKKNEQSSSTSVQIVKALNEMVERQESGLDGPVSYDIVEDWKAQLFLISAFILFVAGVTLGSIALAGGFGR